MVVVGSRLAGRYRVEALIARGGMASVFTAHDEVLDRAVAVKVLRQGEPVDRRRFEREAQMLARLTHPNLVSVYDAGEFDGDVFMVLELIEGPTLAQRLQRGPMREDEVRVVGIDLARAIGYVHQMGIVHRDVKPSNVLFDGEGRTRLGDFGIAHLASSTALTASGTVIGTAAYMAPEQIEGHVATGAADIYALGLVLLECLSGRRSFPGTGAEQALARLSRDPAIPADLRSPWTGLLRAMTARSPAGRPDAASVAGVLGEEQAEHGEAVTVPMVPTTPLAGDGPKAAATAPLATDRRRMGSIGMMLVALLVLAVVVVSLASRSDQEPEPGAAASPTTRLPAAASSATTVPAATTSPSTPPPTTAPVPADQPVDCAALEAEREELKDRKREIDDQYRDDRETRERLKDQIEERKREVDELLRESCR